MENLSKRDRWGQQKAAPGWVDRLAGYDQWLNLSFEQEDNAALLEAQSPSPAAYTSR
jgi:hypothetical protein